MSRKAKRFEACRIPKINDPKPDGIKPLNAALYEKVTASYGKNRDGEDAVVLEFHRSNPDNWNLVTVSANALREWIFDPDSPLDLAGTSWTPVAQHPAKAKALLLLYDREHFIETGTWSESTGYITLTGASRTPLMVANLRQPLGEFIQPPFNTVYDMTERLVKLEGMLSDNIEVLAGLELRLDALEEQLEQDKA